VSEYQYYEFAAVDRPLGARDLDVLRGLSTRAHITPTSFVNTYQWGSFKGDPRRLVERYFDAFLYLANWGTHELILRLPARLVDPGTAQRYCSGDAVSAWHTGDHVIDVRFGADNAACPARGIDGRGRLGGLPDHVPPRAGQRSRLHRAAALSCGPPV